MNKTISLIKATMSQDMDLFKIKKKKNGQSSGFTPFILAALVMMSFGFYADNMAQLLAPMGSTYLVITLFLTGTVMLTLVEAIYKSQSILFGTKDSDLLFSLPITKDIIVFIRIFKMIVFEIMYNALFLLPSLVVYAIYEHPGVPYYFACLLMLVFMPIIPTVLGCIIGYIVKFLSNKFRNKNFMQVVLSMAFVMLVMYGSFNMDSLINSASENADGVNSSIANVYYPIKLCINMVKNFDILDAAKLVVISIIPLIVFVALAGKIYYKVYYSLGRKVQGKELVVTDKTYKQNSQLKSLVGKELKKFLACPILILNAYVGIAIVVVLTGVMLFNFEGLIASFSDGSSQVIEDESAGIADLGNFVITQGEAEDAVIGTNLDAKELEEMINKEVEENSNDVYFEGMTPEYLEEVFNQLLPPILFCVIIVTSFLTFITASLVSLEGKSINITKSLPVSTVKVLWAKILASDVLVIPPLVLCDIAVFIKFGIEPIYMVGILLASIIAPNLTAMWGIILNLRYPKMQYTSDAEVVKQSMSVMMASFSGIFFSMIAVGFVIAIPNKIAAMIGVLIVLAFLTLLLSNIISNWGAKKFNSINV